MAHAVPSRKAQPRLPLVVFLLAISASAREITENSTTMTTSNIVQHRVPGERKTEDQEPAQEPIDEDNCGSTEGPALDSKDRDCSAYAGDSSLCAGFDDDDFTSTQMCCACGGGEDQLLVSQPESQETQETKPTLPKGVSADKAQETQETKPTPPKGVSAEIAKDFLKALHDEFVLKKNDALDDFYKADHISEEVEGLLIPFEAQIDKSKDKSVAIDALAEKWLIAPPSGKTPSWEDTTASDETTEAPLERPKPTEAPLESPIGEHWQQAKCGNCEACLSHDGECVPGRNFGLGPEQKTGCIKEGGVWCGEEPIGPGSGEMTEAPTEAPIEANTTINTASQPSSTCTSGANCGWQSNELGKLIVQLESRTSELWTVNEKLAKNISVVETEKDRLAKELQAKDEELERLTKEAKDLEVQISEFEEKIEKVTKDYTKTLADTAKALADVDGPVAVMANNGSTEQIVKLN